MGVGLEVAAFLFRAVGAGPFQARAVAILQRTERFLVRGAQTTLEGVEVRCYSPAISSPGPSRSASSGVTTSAPPSNTSPDRANTRSLQPASISFFQSG